MRKGAVPAVECVPGHVAGSQPEAALPEQSQAVAGLQSAWATRQIRCRFDTITNQEAAACACSQAGIM
jgi:hypothetical protein